MEKLISAKPCVWDVTNKYLTLGQREERAGGTNSTKKLSFHQKSRTKGNPPPTKTKTVILNDIVTMFELGKDNEYYSKNGQSLTGLIMASAATRNNKLVIY